MLCTDQIALGSAVRTAKLQFASANLESALQKEKNFRAPYAPPQDQTDQDTIVHQLVELRYQLTIAQKPLNLAATAFEKVTQDWQESLRQQ